MLAIYIITAIVGGGLLLLSALGGASDHGFDSHDVDMSHDVDLSHDVDMSHDADLSHDVDHSVDHGADHGADHGGGMHGVVPWLPFLSLRFWTYLCAVFGVVGFTLSKWVGTPEPMAAIYAAATGLLTGTAVATIMRALSLSDSDSMAKPNDMLGTVADVLVALRGDQPGRIRVCVRGDTVDMLALTQDGSTVEPGEQVVVVGVEGDRVTVVPSSAIYD